MKRVIAVLLLLCLLTGCSKTSTVKQTNEKKQSATTAPTEAPTEPAPTEPEVTDTVAYRHPLTGEPMESAWSGRPVAVVIPNNKEAYPHHGTGNADILYEIEAEGGVTRCLALFSDLTDIPKIGPVRSARTYFNNVAYSYNAPIAHCGGSPGGISGRYDSATGAKIPEWPHIDEMYNGSYFYRDTNRYENLGYLWEYTLFTKGDLLQGAMTANGYTAETASYDLVFGDTSSAEGGDSGVKVVINFRGDKKTTLDFVDGRYEMTQHGKTYTDGNTGEKVTFRNVLVLEAEQWYDTEGYRTYYTLIGTGTGYYACDGKMVPIKWVRPTLADSFSYTLEDGTPITLGEGTSYIAITGQKNAVTFE